MAGISLFSEASWLTAERVRRIARIFAVLSLVMLAVDFWGHTQAGLTNPQGEQLGRDFVNYWAGAHEAAAGRAKQVYDIDAFLHYERSQTAPNAEFKWYAYPPVALLLSLPLALLGYIPAFILWLTSDVLFCAALLARTGGWRMAWLASPTPATLINALSGQNGQFVAGLLGGGILLLETQPWLAGLFFGALAFKPHLAVLVPIALAAGGHWRTFASAAVAAVALVLISGVLFGFDSWTAYLHVAPLNARLMEQGVTFWHRTPSVFAMVRLLGGGITIAYGVQAASAIAAAVVTIQAWRGDAAITIKGAVLILAGFLATPYFWDYDLVALAFVTLWVVADAERDGFLPWEKMVLALSLAMPLFVPAVAKLTHVQLGPFILWSALYLTARRATQPSLRPIGQTQPA